MRELRPDPLGAGGDRASSTTSPGFGPGSTGNYSARGPVLSKIYQGKITSWNDPAIKKLNPGKNLPATKITVVHRSDSSGTTYNFTDYLSHVSASWKSAVGTGTSVDWPTGFGGKGSSGVAGIVRQTPGAIGYADVEYSIKNHLPYFRMLNRAGTFAFPRLKGIRQAAELDTTPAKDGSLSIVNPPKKKKFKQAYPISTYTYVDVQKTSANAAKHQEADQLGDHQGSVVRPEDLLPAASELLS